MAVYNHTTLQHRSSEYTVGILASSHHYTICPLSVQESCKSQQVPLNCMCHQPTWKPLYTLMNLYSNLNPGTESGMELRQKQFEDETVTLTLWASSCCLTTSISEWLGCSLSCTCTCNGVHMYTIINNHELSIIQTYHHTCAHDIYKHTQLYTNIPTQMHTIHVHV